MGWIEKDKNTFTRLLLSRYDNLKEEKQKEALNYILINYSEDLRIVYREKEEILKIVQMENKKTSNRKIKCMDKEKFRIRYTSIKRLCSNIL